MGIRFPRKARRTSLVACALALAPLLAAGCAPDRPLMTLCGGVVASARTDLGTGTGWTAVIGGGGEGGIPFGPVYLRSEVSAIEYDDNGTRREITKVTVGAATLVFVEGYLLSGGMGLSLGDGDTWALGPHLMVGTGFFGRHAELYLAASGYAWIGERDDEFDFDLEADVRLAAGIRF